MNAWMREDGGATATEFWPPAFARFVERRRQAEDVIAALNHASRDVSPRERDLGVRLYEAAEPFRCPNCQIPRQAGSKVASVPDNVKESDPRWYVKAQAQHFSRRYSSDGWVVWCDNCVWRFPA